MNGSKGRIVVAPESRFVPGDGINRAFGHDLHGLDLVEGDEPAASAIMDTTFVRIRLREKLILYRSKVYIPF